MIKFLKKCLEKKCLEWKGQYGPSRKRDTDAGFDLYLSKCLELKPQEVKTVELELRVNIPKGFVGLILPRSSVSAKGLHVCTGVIDAGFVGKLQVCVKNMHSHSKYCYADHDVNLFFYEGDRLCQLVLLPSPLFYLKQVKEFTKYGDRGEKGVGSSGR